MRTTARFRTLKRLIVAVISSGPMGRLIAAIFRDRIPTGGSVIDTGNPLISPQTKAMVFWGIYESAEARFVDRYLRPDLDTVELGASLGVIGSRVTAKLQSAQRYVGVEANPGLYQTLLGNVTANAATKNVTIVSAAIDYGGGETVTLDLGDNSYSASIVKDQNRGIAVPAMPLDELLVFGGISGDFQLVMDIEGAELALLEHEHDSLSRCRSMIVEFHTVVGTGGTTSVEDLIEIAVVQHGLRLVDRYGPVCFLERR